ncbi:6-bladed beta-propeller [Aureibaculum sp. 2210JD6-5]|uniref:6-bladed beta-propeller n=1 Tax=Aureibaculum sp. 2210JD6-5 TaxID=3103957 RepID=UPI002AAD9710|nr:6-bladed beta-propeller [Aureibaculum sp. 2210JD6-5]MDY7396714.1 6-bladed beta-propeller [Aureibaculum sp. 2210JD6-5]
MINCKPDNNKINSGYYIVDFDNAKDKEMKLYEVADSLKFTFLQYDKENPVGEILHYKVTENYLFIVDQQQKLFVFKKNGDLVTFIYNKGRGPSEYITIEDFIVDSREESIFILSPTSGKLLKYDIYGNFIESFSINYTHAAHISKLTNGNYCIYQSARFSENNFNIFFLDKNFQVINSVIDSKGAFIKKIPYLLDVVWGNHNNSTYYKEVLSDTVFKINQKNTSEPYILFDLGKKRMPDKYYEKTGYYQKNAHKFYQVGSILESGKYFFLQIAYNNEKKYFLYKKNNNESLIINLGTKGFSNNIDIDFWPEYIDDSETMYRFIDPIELRSKLKETSEANEIKNILDSNDNPVLLSGKLLD